MKTKILLVDDHRMIRQGLRTLLQAENDFEVIGEAEDGRSAVAKMVELSPDVVVMDFHMPGLNGVEATRQVLQQHPKTKVICLSSDSVEMAIEQMLRAGAVGFVLKESAFEELVTAIHTVISNKVYLTPSVTSAVVADYVRGTGPLGSGTLDNLSPREREIVQLMAEGCATKQIAMKLNVSVKTVEAHRRNLMEKLQIDTVAGITKYAIRRGITSV